MAALLLLMILIAILLVIQGIRHRNTMFTLLACIPFLLIFTPILFLLLGKPEPQLLINISLSLFWTTLIVLYAILFGISVVKKQKTTAIMSLIQICITAFWFSFISGFMF
ncbi:hypothetical protein ACFQZ1_00735 [Bacillus sp. CGMCC 1.60114]|jgi:hypothetical protein|uniref:hypothetical protein n=1 Tax=Bacillus TaxID=1386 RepID=UPI003630F84C